MFPEACSNFYNFREQRYPCFSTCHTILPGETSLKKIDAKLLKWTLRALRWDQLDRYTTLWSYNSYNSLRSLKLRSYKIINFKNPIYQEFWIIVLLETIDNLSSIVLLSTSVQTLLESGKILHFYNNF